MHQENVGRQGESESPMRDRNASEADRFSRHRGMVELVSRFKIPPGFRAIRLKSDDTPFFGWQTEDIEPDDDYRSMGKVPGKGYAFVDTDPRNNLNVEEKLVEKYGEELISGWVERTPGGGFHIPVRLPEDLWEMPQSQNGKENKDLPSLPYGVDIKVGGKGYGLARGSQRARDGGWYTLAQEGRVIDLPEAMANDIRCDLVKKRKAAAAAEAELPEINAAVGSTNGPSKRAPSTGYAWEDPLDAATRIMAARIPPDDWHEWSKLCCAFLSAGKSVDEVEAWCRKNTAKYRATEDRRFLEKQVARGYNVGIGHAVKWDRRMGGETAPKAKSKKWSGQLRFSVEHNAREKRRKRGRIDYAWRQFEKGHDIETVTGMLNETAAGGVNADTVERYLREAMKAFAREMLEELGEMGPLEAAGNRHLLYALGAMSRGRWSSVIATRENRTLDRRIHRHAKKELSLRAIASKVGLGRSAVAERKKVIETNPWWNKTPKQVLAAIRREVGAVKKRREAANRIHVRVRARVRGWRRTPCHLSENGRDHYRVIWTEVTGWWNGNRLLLDKPLGETRKKTPETIDAMWDAESGRVVRFG